MNAVRAIEMAKECASLRKEQNFKDQLLATAQYWIDQAVRAWHTGNVKDALAFAAKSIAYSVGRNHPSYAAVKGT